jgi:hypothetical protein
MNASYDAKKGFADRFRITSTRGRIQTYEMLRRAALRRLRRSPLPLPTGKALSDLPNNERGALVDSVLEDHKFMTWRCGMILVRVVEDIEQRAWELAAVGTKT